jgi:hypothetical protein
MGRGTTEREVGSGMSTFCTTLVKDEDDGRTRKCLMVLIPDEACTHHRPRRSDTARVVIDQARQSLAERQGGLEREATEQEQARERARETAA